MKSDAVDKMKEEKKQKETERKTEQL